MNSTVKTRSVNLTKRKRRRDPCEDNDPGSATRWVSIKQEPECAGYKDPVSLEYINADAGICAGKTCWDYDSFVKSIRKESENRGGAAFRDPLTRNIVTIFDVARARPKGASTPMEEIMAPVAQNAALDPDYQTRVDAGNTQNRDLEPEDAAVYDDDYDSSSSDEDYDNDDDDEIVNEITRGSLQRCRTILNHPFNPPDLNDTQHARWNAIKHIENQLKALITVSFSSPRGGTISEWADIGADGHEFEVIGVFIPHEPLVEYGPGGWTHREAPTDFHTECTAVLRVVKRLLQLYGLAEFDLANRETGPNWTCDLQTIELEQVYAAVDALRRKQQEVGERIASIIDEITSYGGWVHRPGFDLSLTGLIEMIELLEEDVYLVDLDYDKLQKLVLDNFNLGSTGRGPAYTIEDVTHMKSFIPLPLRLALLDETIGISTGPGLKETLETLKRPYDAKVKLSAKADAGESCSAARRTFRRHPVTKNSAPQGFAWISIDCWRGPNLPATLVEGYYLILQGG